MSCVLNVFIVLIIISVTVFAYFYFTKKTGIICAANTKPTCVPISIEPFHGGVICEVTCNNGSTENIQGGNCSCTCQGNWVGDTCSDCGLTCNNGSTANSDCSSCICQGNWSGNTCSYCNLTCNNGSKATDDCTKCICTDNWIGDTCSDCGLKCDTSRNMYAPIECSSCKFDGPYMPMCNLSTESEIRSAGDPFYLADKNNQEYLQLSQHNMRCGTVWLLTPYTGVGAPGLFRLANIGTPLSPNATQLQVQTPDGSNKWQSLYVDVCKVIHIDGKGMGYLTVAKAEDAYVPTCTIPTIFTWQPTGVDGFHVFISNGCRVDGSMYRQDMEGVTYYGNGAVTDDDIFDRDTSANGELVVLGIEWHKELKDYY